MSNSLDQAARPGVAGVARDLALRVTTSVECVEACLARISESDADLNTLVYLDAPAALEEAGRSDERRGSSTPLSPLDGVPVVIKDNIDIAGQPTTNGLAVSRVARRDAGVIAALRDRGLVPLGKANMHEGALGATTDNPHHGRTANPAAPGCTPGGSSGGSAAAVAAGLVPGALGTDTMGSVRVPAAYCGVVGFKPSRGFWPTDGVSVLSTSLDTVGPLAWTVEDTRLLAGLPKPQTVVRDLGLVTIENFESTSLHPTSAAVWKEVLGALAGNGVGVRRVLLADYDPAVARRAGLLVSEVEAAHAHSAMLRGQPDAFSPTFRAMLHYGAATLAPRYLEAMDHVRRIGETMSRVMKTTDAIISLTTPQPPFDFDDEVPVSQADFTAPANFAGCPSISVPIPRAAGDLPVGLQLMASAGDDVRLHAIAAWIETLLHREFGSS